MTDNLSFDFSSGYSQFPVHDGPRVWLISSGDSPIGISLTRRILAHGDYVVTGITPINSERGDTRSAQFEDFLEEVLENAENGWNERMISVNLDIRMVSQCQAAVAAAMDKFGRVDILLCCTSQAVIGSVEELAASEHTRMLANDQFETNYFGPVNLIKAVLPHMRAQRTGHIMVSGGITGHIGTPGLGVYCAAGWALEGFCDSLTYEVAPFNIRVTILQSNMETGVLANLLTSVPPMLPAYSPSTNGAPLIRGIMNSILSQLPGVSGSRSQSQSLSQPQSQSQTPFSPMSSEREEPSDDGVEGNLPLSSPEVVSLYPPLSPEHLDILTAETVHAITSTGGHENPPARHIVGIESVSGVKEKLKTVSEELEDFIDCSCAVDINSDESSMRLVSEDTTTA